MTEKWVFNELKCYQKQSENPKVNIILFSRKKYQCTDLEENWSKLYQIVPVVSHL